MIENYLQKGHKNAITRDMLCALTLQSDRKNREEIAEAVRERHVPIINVGYGYFIYDGTEEDDAELEEYYRKETKRAKMIFAKLQTIKERVNFDRNQMVINDD